MKTVVGFCFTDNPVERLTQAGFDFFRNDATSANGYYEFLCALSAEGLNLEIREVIDEELYFRFQNSRSFAPFAYDRARLPPNWPQHPNSVFAAGAVLGHEMENGELKDHVMPRKKHDICAVWLQCRDLKLFYSKAGPLKEYRYRDKPAYLIELGPSCFDLVVT